MLSSSSFNGDSVDLPVIIFGIQGHLFSSKESTSWSTISQQWGVFYFVEYSKTVIVFKWRMEL